MKRSPELLTQIAECIADDTSFANVCRRVGISVSSFWSFVAQSKAGHPGFILPSFRGKESIPFHEAIKLSRKMAIASVVANAESRALHGHREPVFFQGKPTWVEDESLSHLTDEDLVTFGIPDRYLRIDGKRVQHTMHVQPPVSLALAV